MSTTSLYHRLLGSAEPTKVVAQYIWGARPGHRDELILRDRDTSGDGVLDERLYCLMDYFNPVAVIDTAGTVKERYAWSAFGVRTVMERDWTVRSEGGFAWDLGFHGQFFDGETGYYDYGFRFYSPHSGRWLSKDQIGEFGGANIYRFARNGPMNVQDYLGLILQSEEEYLESAKRAWFKAPPEGKSTEAKVWVSLADENLELLNGAGSSVFAIVANLIASPAWVDRIHEQGGWILQVGGEVRSDLDWTSAGVSGGMVLPSKPIPSNTIAEIHTHPWGSGPTISLEMFQGSFTYMQPDPGWSALGGSDGPERPDIVAYVLSNSEDLSNPPRPVTLYRFWWRIRVDCNGRADRAQLTDPETMNV